MCRSRKNLWGDADTPSPLLFGLDATENEQSDFAMQIGFSINFHLDGDSTMWRSFHRCIASKGKEVMKLKKLKWAIKRKSKRLRDIFIAMFRHYSCWVCKSNKRIWKMQKCNIYNPTYSGNICCNCWNATGEKPFFFCDTCLTSKPYDRMIRTGKKSWICGNCENPSGVSIQAS